MDRFNLILTFSSGMPEQTRLQGSSIVPSEEPDPVGAAQPVVGGRGNRGSVLL